MIKPAGLKWTIRWSIEPDNGVLLLQSEAETPALVRFLTAAFTGCDITKHMLVTVSNFVLLYVFWDEHGAHTAFGRMAKAEARQWA